MNRRWPASDTVPSSTGAKSRNTCTALLQIHVCHTSLIIRISLSKYTTEEKTMHEILEDDENVGAPGSWASPRLDENHHTSARRFRLPIKGVFPFDAPPRRYFLFFFFFRYVILAVVSLSVDDIHRVVVVFYVSVKGERRWFVSRACTALFLSIRVFLSIHFSSSIILYYFFFSFLFAGSETQNTGYGEYYIHRVAVYANTAKQNRPEDVFELLRTLQTPLTAESASARLRRPTPLMRRPTAS